jgi:fumarate hydratase class I
LGKINRDGLWLEELETDPSKYIPDVTNDHFEGEVVKIDLN